MRATPLQKSKPPFLKPDNEGNGNTKLISMVHESEIKP